MATTGPAVQATEVSLAYAREMWATSRRSYWWVRTRHTEKVSMLGMHAHKTVTYRQTSTITETTVQQPVERIHVRPALRAAVRGAGIGAVAGIVLPLISPLSGGVIGAALGYAMYRHRHSASSDGSSAYYNSGIVPPWLGGYRPGLVGSIASGMPLMVSPYDAAYASAFGMLSY